METPAHVPSETVRFVAEPRPLGRAMGRGFLGRCPHCNEGRLFGRFLKPVAECAACGENFSHHRAGDAPPYVTMLLSGHILVPIMLAVQMEVEWSTTTHLMIWLPLIGFVTLALLQPVKGAIVAFQWALRMHGFDGHPDPDRYDRIMAPVVDAAAPRRP